MAGKKKKRRRRMRRRRRDKSTGRPKMVGGRWAPNSRSRGPTTVVQLSARSRVKLSPVPSPRNRNVNDENKEM